MLLPYLIYNLSDRGDEFSAAEHSNASAYEMRSVQARSRIRLSYASLARDHSPLPTLSLSHNKAQHHRPSCASSTSMESMAFRTTVVDIDRSSASAHPMVSAVACASDLASPLRTASGGRPHLGNL